MPSLADLDMTVSPSQDPLTYPGKATHGSCVLFDGWLYRLRAVEGTPVDGWPLLLDGGPLSGRWRTEPTLAQVLMSRGLASMEDRHPVLAVGSNASPAQLAWKFRHQPVAIPMIELSVTGIGVVHSAHVSAAGYVPYAPIASPKSRRKLPALWLDQEQRYVMDSTERNYRPTLLGSTMSVATLETAEEISECTLYSGRKGVLLRSPHGSAFAAGGQSAVYELLRRLDAVSGAESDRALARRLARSERLRDSIREELLVRGYVSGDDSMSALNARLASDNQEIGS
jgi:hypothetical protein